MKIYCGIFCMKRYQFLRDCIKSMKRSEKCSVYAVPMDAQAFQIATRASSDLTGVLYQQPERTLYGNIRLFAETMMSLGAEEDSVLVFCADDYKWHPGWQDKLLRFIDGNPERISHMTGDLEPVFPWNTIYRKIDHNGVTGLHRQTVPGANLVFCMERWLAIRELWRSLEHDIILDHRLNKMANDNNRMTVALNLADHLGMNSTSTMGNQSWSRPDCIPLPEEYRNI